MRQLSQEPSDLEIVEDGDRLLVRTSEGTFSALVARQGPLTWVSYRGRQYVFGTEPRRRSATSHHRGDTCAPMPGRIVESFVELGQQVSAGQRLMVLEAMKMQHAVTAPFAGTVTGVFARVGDQVADAAQLVHVEPASENPD